MINSSPACQKIAFTCLKGHPCRMRERWRCSSPACRDFLLSFIFRISWESWEWRTISDCVWFKSSPDLFTLRKRSCESSKDTTALFCGTLCFYAFFHTMLSHGVSQQQQGTAELKKLAVLLFVFLEAKIGRSNSNSYKLEFSCVRVALWKQS